MLLLVAILLLPNLHTGNARNEHVLAIYGNDQSKIIVADTELRTTLKTFTVQASVTSGIAIVYNKDLIFFSDEDGTVYRIHLLDENGNRNVSGKGRLFTDNDAEHSEQRFYDTGYPIVDLIYDEEKDLLYIITPLYILRFDPDEDPDCEKKCSFISKYATMSSVTPQHAVITGGLLYLADNSHVYSLPTSAIGYMPRFTMFAKMKSVTAFSIDNTTKNLYYFSMNTMRVLDPNTSVSIQHNKKDLHRVILANGAYTKAVHSLAVLGDLAVWSSCAWKKLFVGKLNFRRDFISKRNVRVLDSFHHVDPDDDSCFHNVNLFHHDYDA